MIIVLAPVLQSVVDNPTPALKVYANAEQHPNALACKFVKMGLANVGPIVTARPLI